MNTRIRSQLSHKKGLPMLSLKSRILSYRVYKVGEQEATIKTCRFHTQNFLLVVRQQKFEGSTQILVIL